MYLLVVLLKLLARHPLGQFLLGTVFAFIGIGVIVAALTTHDQNTLIFRFLFALFWLALATLSVQENHGWGQCLTFPSRPRLPLNESGTKCKTN